MKIGRNDPCHCGSGLKYKKCHYEKDEAARSAELAAQAAARAKELPPEDAAPEEGAPATGAKGTVPRPEGGDATRPHQKGFSAGAAKLPRRGAV